MLYDVIYDASTKIRMTKEEVQGFLKALQEGKDVIEFKGQFLTKFFRVIAEAEQTAGRLHDGTKVIKIMGQWKDALDPTVKLNPTYYPEILTDKIISESDWQKKQLTSGV